MKVKIAVVCRHIFTYFSGFSIEFFQLIQHETPIRFVFRICTNLSCVTREYSCIDVPLTVVFVYLYEKTLLRRVAFGIITIRRTQNL